MASDAFHGYFNNARHSDLTIICGEKKFRAHKIVLCALSDVIRKALEGPFKEALQNELDLSEDDPFLIELMLEFMYSVIRFDPEPLRKDAAELFIDAAMFWMSDKYQIPSMTATFDYRFREVLAGSRPLYSMRMVLAYIPTLYGLLPASNSGIRKPLVRQIAREHTLLLTSGMPEQCVFHAYTDALARAMSSQPEFAADMAIAMSEWLVRPPIDRKLCPNFCEHEQRCCVSCETQICTDNVWHKSAVTQGSDIATCDKCLLYEIKQDWKRVSEQGNLPVPADQLFYMVA